jgi:uncharacterized phiE125 gp8 family phage protein
MITLTEITSGAPALALAEIRQQVRQDHAEDDAQLMALEAAARRHVRRYAGFSMSSQQFVLIADGFPTGRLLLPIAPVTAVSLIEYLSNDVWVTWPAENWRFVAERGQLLPRSGWPAVDAGLATVRIALAAGPATPADLPDDVRAAALLLVEQLYEKHEDFENQIATLLRPWRQLRVGEN